MLASVLLIFPHKSFGVKTEETGCATHARQWIQRLEHDLDYELLVRNTHSDCEFSAKWMEENSGSDSEQIWQRMCKDLVLIWTHKKCIYYRDYIHHSTYTPCKEWTRQMYSHCMDHDKNWFYK